MSHTVERFAAMLRVTIYFARLFSMWLYTISTFFASILFFVDTPNYELLERTNDPIVAKSVQWSIIISSGLFLTLPCYYSYYWMKMGRKWPKLALREVILLIISVDLIVNPIWINWIFFYSLGLGERQLRTVVFLGLWGIHSITTLVTIVGIGKGVYIGCIGCVKYHICDPNGGESISLLTMTTIGEEKRKSRIEMAA
jgi:hypothetical protein